MPSGYDIGVSASSSKSSSATGSSIGSNSIVDNSSIGTTSHTVIILGVLGFIAVVFWVLFHNSK